MTISPHRERVRFYICVLIIAAIAYYLLLHEPTEGIFKRYLMTTMIVLVIINLQYVRLARNLSELSIEGDELAQAAGSTPYSGGRLLPFSGGVLWCTLELLSSDAGTPILMASIACCLLLLMVCIFERAMTRFQKLLPSDQSQVSILTDYQQALAVMSQCRKEPLFARVATAIRHISITALSSDIIVFLIIVLWFGYFVVVMLRG